MAQRTSDDQTKGERSNQSSIISIDDGNTVSTSEQIAAELEDDTPWIKVDNDEFKRDILKFSIIIIGSISSIIIILWYLMAELNIPLLEQSIRIGDLLTAISISAALVVGTAGYLSQKSAARRSHAINLLSQTTTNHDLFASFQTIYHIDHEELKRKIESDTLPDSEFDDIVQVLNFYDFIATSCIANDVDQAVILKVRGDNMSNIHQKVDPFIKYIREKHSPEVWGGFTNIVKHYEEKKQQHQRMHPR